MKSTDAHITRPEVTTRGIAMAVFFWLLYTLFSAALLTISDSVPFINALTGMGLSNLLMAVLMIPSWFLIVRGLHRQSGWIKAVVHLLVGIIYTFAWYYLYLFLFDLFFGIELLGEGFINNSGWILFTTFMVYAITFAVIHTIESLKQLRLKEKQTSELKELSRQQEIATLKAQLNPHFLFNTLNSINASVSKDPEQTREMITKLSEMLRYSLDSFEKAEVPLKEELNFVKTYLDLEQKRLGDRLEVTIEADQQIKDIPVPPMILQPLAENAVKHGIAPVDRGGGITITIKEQQEEIIFIVKDTGKGISKNHEKDTKGIGLRNIDEMLTTRFGEKYGLTISQNKPSGTIITFSVPF